MTPTFDRFVAMDWSGSKSRRYTGIAVAVCDVGCGAPKLVAPAGGAWSRTAVAAWLTAEVARRKRLLVGFDFGFGFPFEDGLGYLGGGAPRATDVFSLWDEIDRLSCDDADFGCGGMVAAHAELFWTEGTKPPHWVERRRLSEGACGAATKTYPESLYKLLHSKQVGKASMTGIRVLNEVRRRSGGRFSIWPFEPPGESVAVEIYPTLFRKQALGSTAKIKRRADLNKALQTFDARPTGGTADDILTDHDTDALLAAAALRRIAGEPNLWATPDHPRVRREGWIFGVSSVGWSHD